MSIKKCITLIGIVIFLATLANCQNNRVKFHDLPQQVFRVGYMTNGRRSEPIAQITCKPGHGNPSCSKGPPEIRCEIISKIGKSDAIWKCYAIVGSGYKISNYEVSCEGYDYPDDPYILEGSCGVEYTLDVSPEGEYLRKQDHGASTTTTITTEEKIVKVNNIYEPTLDDYVGMIVFIGVICLFVYTISYMLYDCIVNRKQQFIIRESTTTTTTTEQPSNVNREGVMHNRRSGSASVSSTTYVPQPATPHIPSYSSTQNYPSARTYVSSTTTNYVPTPTPVYIPQPVYVPPPVYRTVVVNNPVDTSATTKTTTTTTTNNGNTSRIDFDGIQRVVSGFGSTKKR